MTDKRLSLEHVIRNIATGNFTPSDTPVISLEHAIKNVVRKKESRESSFAAKDSKPLDEDVGGLVGSGTGGEPKLHAESSKKKIKEDEEDHKLPGNEDKMDEAVGSMGTDKFQGNQFKSVRSSTPHIRPPGPEHGHSQAPENVSRQRSLAKEKTSMTMKGNVTESVKTKTISDFLRGLRTAPTSNLPAVRGTTGVATKKSTEVSARTGTTAVATRKTSVPTGAVPETPPAVKPAEPKVEVKPEVATKPKVDVKTEPKTEPKVAPAKVEPKVDTKVATKTPDLSKVATATAAAIGAGVASLTTPDKKIVATPTTATEPKVAVPTPPVAGVPPIPSELPSKSKRFKFKAPRGGVPHNVDYFVLDYVPVKTQTHFAKKETKYAVKEENERKNIQNVPRPDAGERKELEYVGRKNTKQKTLARNASVKNVIDESKKLAKTVKRVVKETDGLGSGKTKVYDDPPVIINPGLKPIDLNVAEGVVKGLAGLGATYAGFGAAGSVPSAYEKAKKGDYIGAGKELAKGAADAIVSTVKEPYERYKKGDITGAAISAASMVPEIGLPAAALDYAREVGRDPNDKGTPIIPHKVTPGVNTAKTFERMKSSSSSTTPETKPLAPGEGIKLQTKQKVKPLAPGEPIKLK